MALSYDGILGQGLAVGGGPVTISSSVTASTPSLAIWLSIQTLRQGLSAMQAVWANLGDPDCYMFGVNDDGTRLFGQGIGLDASVGFQQPEESWFTQGDIYFVHRDITGGVTTITFDSDGDDVYYVLRLWSGNLTGASVAGLPTIGGVEAFMTDSPNNTAPDQHLSLVIDDATFIIGMGASMGISDDADDPADCCPDGCPAGGFCTRSGSFTDINPDPGSFGTDMVKWSGVGNQVIMVGTTEHDYPTTWYVWTWVEACTPASTWTRDITMPDDGYCCSCPFPSCTPEHPHHGPYAQFIRNHYAINFGHAVSLEGGDSIPCVEVPPQTVHFDGLIQLDGVAMAGSPLSGETVHFTGHSSHAT